MLNSRLHVEIDFTGHPLLVAFGQQGGDKAQTGSGVREDRGNARAPLELAIDPFKTVGRAQTDTVRLRHVEGGKAFGEIIFRPLGKLGRFSGPRFDGLFQQTFGFGSVRRVEDRANTQRDRLALIEAGDIGLGVLLHMKTTPLPGGAGPYAPSPRLEAPVVSAHDLVYP